MPRWGPRESRSVLIVHRYLLPAPALLSERSALAGRQRMQRLLPHPLGPSCLGTCLSAAAWSGGQSSAPCELPETPGSNSFVALTKLPGNPHLRTGHRRPWSSPGRDPSISSGEGLAHVSPNPGKTPPLHRNSKPAHSARHRDPQPRRRRGLPRRAPPGRGLRAGREWGPQP